jgi:hypothetical protein
MTWHDATADHSCVHLFAAHNDTKPDVEARSPKGAVVARAWSTSQGPLIAWTEPLRPPSAERQRLTRERVESEPERFPAWRTYRSKQFGMPPAGGVRLRFRLITDDAPSEVAVWDGKAEAMTAVELDNVRFALRTGRRTIGTTTL